MEALQVRQSSNNMVPLEELVDIKEYTEDMEVALDPLKRVILKVLVDFFYSQGMWHTVHGILLDRLAQRQGWELSYSKIVRELTTMLNKATLAAFSQKGVLYPKLSIVSMYPVAGDTHYMLSLDRRINLISQTAVVVVNSTNNTLRLAFSFYQPSDSQGVLSDGHIDVVLDAKIESLF